MVVASKNEYVGIPKKRGPKTKNPENKKIPLNLSVPIWFAELLMNFDKKIQDKWDKDHKQFSWIIRKVNKPRANGSKEIVFRYLEYESLLANYLTLLSKEYIPNEDIRKDFLSRINLSPNQQYLD